MTIPEGASGHLHDPVVGHEQLDRLLAARGPDGASLIGFNDAGLFVAKGGNIQAAIAAADKWTRSATAARQIASNIPSARTDFLAAQCVRDITNFLNWCTARGKPAILTEFGIPVLPNSGYATYALKGERPRWDGLMERVMNLLDSYGASMCYWDANGWPNNQLSAYSCTPNGDYRSTQRGALNTVTPAGLVLERHIGMGGTTLANAPFRGVNLPLGSYGGPYAYGTSASFSNTRSSGSYALDLSTAGSYNYGQAADYAFLAARGITVVRLSVRFERLFRNSTPAAPVLDPTELAHLREGLANAAASGIRCLIANFGQGSFWIDDGTQGVAHEIGSAAYTTAMYGTMWGMLAQALAGNPGLYGYALDNEPGSGGNPMVYTTWDAAAQAAVTGIRQYDMASFISVPLFNASVYAPEIGTSANFIVDPANNFGYEAHYYPDGSGNYTQTYDQLTSSAKAGGSPAGANSWWTAPDDFIDVRAVAVWLNSSGSAGFFQYDRDQAAHSGKYAGAYVKSGRYRLWSNEINLDFFGVDEVTGALYFKDGSIQPSAFLAGSPQQAGLSRLFAGARRVQILSTVPAAGPITVYTCPAGSKALIGYHTISAGDLSNTTGAQCNMGHTPSTAPTRSQTAIDWIGAPSIQNNWNVVVPFVPGENLRINGQNYPAGSTGSLHYAATVLEIPDPNNMLVVVYFGLTANNEQLVYTAPSGYKAHALSLLPDSWTSSVGVTNYSGGSATVNTRVVRASDSASFQAITPISVGAFLQSSIVPIGFVLNPGDQLYVKSTQVLNVRALFVLE